MRNPLPIVALVIPVLGMGCALFKPAPTPLNLPEAQARLAADEQSLVTVSAHLPATLEEFEALAQAAPWREMGYFTAEQHDQIEILLFQYTACDTALWDMVQFDRRAEDRLPTPETQTRALALAISAGFQLAHARATLVSLFEDDEIATRKLNEQFYRSEIEAGTFDALRDSVTDRENREALRAAWELYQGEVEDPDSPLSRLMGADPVCADLLGDIPALHSETEAQISEIIDSESHVFPGLANRIHHSRTAALERHLAREVGAETYAMQGLLFTNVSRLKSPSSHLVTFSDEQKAQIHSLLQPGDVILTYTSGYMSDVFIPGAFKHGITHVGSPDQRRAAGMSPDAIPGLTEEMRSAMAEHIDFDTLPSGQSADVVEAVAEGVIFNSLDHLLDTHINRLVIFRPRLSDELRARQLCDVFLFLGDTYDFQFDFTDATNECCTEVIYRSLSIPGGVEMSLTEYAGREILSADNFVSQAQRDLSEEFDFVLLALEDPNHTDHRALILTGEEGKAQLTALMEAQKN